MSKPFGFYAPFFQPSGYGIAAHMDALALASVNADFACRSVDACNPRNCFHGRSDDAIRARIEAPLVGKRRLIRYVPAGLPLSPDIDPVFAPFFETERWANETVFTVNMTSRALIVPNEWQAEAARASGVTVPIHVVPSAYDWHVPPGALHDTWNIAPAGARGRLGVVDALGAKTVIWDGAFYSRKNLQGALIAFWRAFREGEARLLIRCTVYQAAHAALLRQVIWETAMSFCSSIKEVDHLPGVEWNLGPQSFETMQQLYLGADAFITLSRAEGVGYGALMASGFGVPVVCTDHPALRETVPHALLVPARKMRAGELIAACPVYQSGQRFVGLDNDDWWWDADLNAAAELLRSAVTSPFRQYARDKAGSVLRKHGLEPVGHALNAVMESI